MAGSFSNVDLVREALQKSISKIRNRIEQIVTTDDRLVLTTSGFLDAIEKEVKYLKIDSNNELEIIAHMLSYSASVRL